MINYVFYVNGLFFEHCNDVIVFIDFIRFGLIVLINKKINVMINLKNNELYILKDSTCFNHI
jgi:hypothetical protein